MKSKLKMASAMVVATLLIGSMAASPISSMVTMANSSSAASSSSSNVSSSTSSTASTANSTVSTASGSSSTASSTVSTTSSSTASTVNTAATGVIKDITIAPGSDETQMDFNWQSDSQSIGIVTVTANGKTTTFSSTGMGTTTMTLDPTTGKYPSGTPMDSGFFANKVTATNLQPNTTYTYTLSNGTFSSPNYTFKTGDGTPNFSFLFAGDPQIGASGDITNDSNGWKDTITKSLGKFNVNFLISAGDQVNGVGTQDQLDGYLSPTQLTSLPMSTTVGNHDNGFNGFSNYDDFFNMPNESTLGATTYSSGDYWYTYGDTLFMNLNTNNKSAAEHKLFMQNAMAKNPNAKWSIVVLHHSVYSVGSHTADAEILDLRTTLTPVFDDLKIDVVLMGHDHSYTRTYQMAGNQPVMNGLTGPQSSVTDPTGTLYLTANSATGSKYYAIKAPAATYAAVESQLNVPTISKIDMTANSFTINTYRTDTMASIDSYTINKTAAAPAPVSPTSSTQTTNATTTGNKTSPKTGDNEDMLFGVEVLTSVIFVTGMGYIIYKIKAV